MSVPSLHVFAAGGREIVTLRLGNGAWKMSSDVRVAEDLEPSKLLFASMAVEFLMSNVGAAAVVERRTAESKVQSLMKYIVACLI